MPGFATQVFKVSPDCGEGRRTAVMPWARALVVRATASALFSEFRPGCWPRGEQVGG